MDFDPQSAQAIKEAMERRRSGNPTPQLDQQSGQAQQTVSPQPQMSTQNTQGVKKPKVSPSDKKLILGALTGELKRLGKAEDMGLKPYE